MQERVYPRSTSHKFWQVRTPHIFTASLSSPILTTLFSQCDRTEPRPFSGMPFMARYDPFSPTMDHPLLNSSPDYTKSNGRNGSLRSRALGNGTFSHGSFTTQLTYRERSRRLRDVEDEKQQLIEVGHSVVSRGTTVLTMYRNRSLYTTSNLAKVSYNSYDLIGSERHSTTTMDSFEKILCRSNCNENRRLW